METLSLDPEQTQNPESNAGSGSGSKYKELTCIECGGPFMGMNGQFCSDRCRKKHTSKNPKPKKNGADDSGKESGKQPSLMGVLNGLPPAAQYIIFNQQKDIDRWEDKYNRELSKREDAEKELAKLRDQLKEVEHKKTLDGITSAKPTIVDQIVEATVPHLGPQLAQGLGALFNKFASGRGQMLGVNGQLDEIGEQQITDINKWFTEQLAADTRAQVYQMLSLLASKQGEDLTNTITHITNLLQNGTTASSNNNGNQYSAVASY